MTPNPPTESSASPSLSRRVLTALRQPAVLIALVATALMISFWTESRLELNEAREDMAHRLAEGDSIAKEGRALAKQSQESLLTLQSKVAVLEVRLEQAQSQQVALESMYQELSRSRDERLLAEIDQSLTIAAQQLQLAGNVEAALIALQEADSRLARAAQPQFVPLRKLISRDIDQLRALPGSNLTGVTLKLESVIMSIDILPLAFEHRPKTVAAATTMKKSMVEPGFWKALATDLWDEMRQLIHIQRVDQPDAALLAPDQTFFLRENLKLRLINARLSMLARDGISFHEDLHQAQTWLERYFDTQARQVQSALTTLKGLDRFDVAQDLPALSETLNAVRNFRVVRGSH